MNQQERKGALHPVDLSIKQLAWVVIEAMKESLVVTNPEGSIIYLNHAAEQLLGTTFTWAFGRRLDKVMTLFPVGPREESVDASVPLPSKAAFDVARMNGYWLLRISDDLALVNITVSPLPQDAAGHHNLLFTIRQIREEGTDLEPFSTLHRGKAMVSRDEFHGRIVNALRATQRWNLEHCLICIQFDMARPEAGEYEQLVATLQKNVRRTDVSCQLGSRKYGVLLEGYSLPHAIRRSFELIRALSCTLSEERIRRRDLSIWIGVVPINQFSASNSANLIGMAMLACYEARHAARGSAVRVYRPGRDARLLASREQPQEKGSST